MNLVLQHGIFGFATLGEIVYFNGVKSYLTAKFPALHVLVPQVAPDGTIEERGTDLGRQILQAQSCGGLDSGEPVHIIAHSMGGLDARFLLSPDNPQNMADRITSLTTISTPHQGSPIADVLISIIDPLDLEDRLIAQSLRMCMAQANIPVGGLRNLTTDGVKSFNDHYRDNDKTQKFSVAGEGRGILLPTCGVLLPAHIFIKEKTGEENDGLVSVSSATWGEGPELWPADHADEIGHNLDRGLLATPVHFDYLAKYEALVDRLQQL